MVTENRGKTTELENLRKLHKWNHKTQEYSDKVEKYNRYAQL